MLPLPRTRICLQRVALTGRVWTDRRPWWRPVLRRGGLSAGLLILIWWMLPFAFPIPAGLLDAPPPSPLLLDRSGGVLDDFPRDDLFRHEPVDFAGIPRGLIDATLVAEDKRFFQHDGMDYFATARAIKQLLSERRIISGASTISQQLVKISSPPASRSVPTKIREALTARRLESSWKKEEILTAYLNRIDYGNHRQGCLEAAQFYFGKPLSDLSLAESALLAALPQSPTRLDPHRRPATALARRDWILDRLVSVLGYDEGTITAAKAEPLRLHKRPPHTLAPHLAAAWRTRAGSGSPRFQTTIDGDLQNKINGIVKDELAALTNSNVRHAAVVVLDNRSGEILSLVGSGDFDDLRGGQINGALVPRSAGSTLKPFTYLLALEKHGLYPGSIIADVPTPYRTEEGLDLPKNFDRRHYGPVTIRHALSNSLNVSAMRTLNRIGGPQPLHRLLREFGITTLDRPAAEYGLGLTIGNAEVSLLELTNAYATLARLGHRQPTILQGGASPHPGSRLQSPVTTPQASYLIADILSDNEARSSAFGHRSALRLPFRCAVKTGTSSDFRDNWCLGFTADLTVGVWVGNFDTTPMRGISGVSGAGPIFHRAMLASQAAAERPPRWLDPPEELARITIDSRTGRRFPDEVELPAGRPFATPELCDANRLPLPVRSTDYDAQGRALLDQRFHEWFQSEDNSRRTDLALASMSMSTAATERLTSLAPKIISPIPTATYLLDPELPSGGKRLKLLSNLPGNARWTSPTLQIEGDTAHLQPGHHQITLTDPQSGQSLTREIVVESL